jgi:fatty acid desaturase
MNLKTTSSYASELRPLLSRGAFAPASSRLFWLPVHLLVIAGATAAIALGWVGWPFALGLSLVIGASFAGLTFVGHEALHGALVRGKTLRRLIGWLGFLPFAVSPRFWEAWHNRVHHGNTNRAELDPDAYPTLQQYEASRAIRRGIDWISPGRHRLAGGFSLFFGFTVHSTHVLITAARTGLLSRAQHRLALLETALGWAFWLGVALAVGPLSFLLSFGIPLLVGNAIIMSLILTNHSLSPHTAVNDPLVNSLSVTGPRWLEWLTLGFGYHVEHHLFPAMSARHGGELRNLLRQRWPERYQSLPYFKALLALHRSPRVYEDDTTLLDPTTGVTTPTLGPRILRTQPGVRRNPAAAEVGDVQAPQILPRLDGGESPRSTTRDGNLARAGWIDPSGSAN